MPQCSNPVCKREEKEPEIGSADPISGRFKKCGRCGKVAYCSKACQTLHWKTTHKDACGKEEGKETDVIEISMNPKNLAESLKKLEVLETTLGIVPVDTEFDLQFKKNEVVIEGELLPPGVEPCFSEITHWLARGREFEKYFSVTLSPWEEDEYREWVTIDLCYKTEKEERGERGVRRDILGFLMEEGKCFKDELKKYQASSDASKEVAMPFVELLLLSDRQHVTAVTRNFDEIERNERRKTRVCEAVFEGACLPDRLSLLEYAAEKSGLADESELKIDEKEYSGSVTLCFKHTDMLLTAYALEFFYDYNIEVSEDSDEFVGGLFRMLEGVLIEFRDHALRLNSWKPPKVPDFKNSNEPSDLTERERELLKLAKGTSPSPGVMEWRNTMLIWSGRCLVRPFEYHSFLIANDWIFPRFLINLFMPDSIFSYFANLFDIGKSNWSKLVHFLDIKQDPEKTEVILCAFFEYFQEARKALIHYSYKATHKVKPERTKKGKAMNGCQKMDEEPEQEKEKKEKDSERSEEEKGEASGGGEGEEECEYCQNPKRPTLEDILGKVDSVMLQYFQSDLFRCLWHILVEVKHIVKPNAAERTNGKFELEIFEKPWLLVDLPSLERRRDEFINLAIEIRCVPLLRYIYRMSGKLGVPEVMITDKHLWNIRKLTVPKEFRKSKDPGKVFLCSLAKTTPDSLEEVLSAHIESSALKKQLKEICGKAPSAKNKSRYHRDGVRKISINE